MYWGISVRVDPLSPPSGPLATRSTPAASKAEAPGGPPTEDQVSVSKRARDTLEARERGEEQTEERKDEKAKKAKARAGEARQRRASRAYLRQK